MINPKIGKYWIEAMDLIDSSSQAVLSRYEIYPVRSEENQVQFCLLKFMQL